MQPFNLLWPLFILIADILLWPEQAVGRHLQEASQEAQGRRKPRSAYEICHRLFIVLTIIGLCLLLLWK